METSTLAFTVSFAFVRNDPPWGKILRTIPFLPGKSYEKKILLLVGNYTALFQFV